MQQWEYCVITGVDQSVGRFTGSYPTLTVFSKKGFDRQVDLSNQGKQNRPAGFTKVSEAGYIAHVIAELGLDGWELVGVGQGSSSQGCGAQSLYFKRPIEGKSER